jgi:hypothetical protein
MKEPQNPRDESVTIYKGTIIQWTSDIDGDFWREELDHDIKGVEDPDGWFASYSHQFSSSVLSVGDHKITCTASEIRRSQTYNLAKKSIIVHITESQGTTTTTTTNGGDGGDGGQSITECEAMHEIEIYAGEPEYYGPDCYAKIYVNNKSDQYINVISCQYDTHVSEINGCWCSVFSPGANDYIIDSGWISATMSDGSQRTQKTTVVAATYSTEGCAWICNDLADRVLDVPIPTTNVESMNPCK